MTKIGKSDSVIRVEEFLRKQVASCEVKELQKTARTAKDAANSLNVCLGAIVKTLVFYCEHKGIRSPLIALMSGDRTCDLDKLKDHLKLSGKISQMDAFEVKKITGFTIGGVSPIGLKNAVPIAIDESLFRFDEVWCAAGHPFFVFHIPPGKLVQITKGIVSPNLAIGKEN